MMRYELFIIVIIIIIIVRPSRLVAVGDRAFPVADANLWNDFPDELAPLQFKPSFRGVNLTRFYSADHIMTAQSL